MECLTRGIKLPSYFFYCWCNGAHGGALRWGQKMNPMMIKLAISIIAFALVGGLIVYTKRTHDKNVLLTEQIKQAKLQASANQEAHNNAILSIQKKLSAQSRANADLHRQSVEAKQKVDKLTSKLSKHDLEVLLWDKPGLLSSRINKGTKQLHADIEAKTKGFAMR